VNRQRVKLLEDRLVMESKNKVLILAPHYKSFIKELVEATSSYVGSINILIHHNYLTEIFTYFPAALYLHHVRRYTKANLLDLKGKPRNIDVYLVSLLYFVTDGKNKSLGDKITKKAEKFIQERGLRFDLIHAHFTYPCGYTGVNLGEKFGVPVIITAHGYDVYDLPFRDKEWEEKIKWTLNKADHIITVSQSNKKILVEKLGVSENKLSIIPNGFNPKLFHSITNKTSVKQKLGLSIDKKIILNVADLYPVKGQRYLIEAMKEIIKYRKDILCIIIGDGVLRKNLKTQVRKLGLENYVQLAGSKPHDEIPLWMNAADLFVLPSLSEGNPTVMFEALGCGKPFVGTKVGGVPEVIASEDYGLLCEPANAEDLAEKILTALEKQWNTEKIRRYAEQFTWENIAKRVIEIYNDLLA